MVVLDGDLAVGLEQITLNTYTSMYAGTNRRYDKRGSRISYVHSSIPHCPLWKHECVWIL